MAVPTLSEAGRAQAAGLRRAALSLPGVVLALAVPLVFLHVDFQPKVTVTVGGLRGSADLSDAAVLLVGLAGLLEGARAGFRPLRAGWPVWISSAALLAMLFAATFHPLLGDDDYAWRTHLVTAGKFAEYALLALAVPLLVRARAALDPLLAAIAAWSVAATAVGFVQFFGWGILDGWPAGRRQPSFLGHHDFAALSGAALAIALVSVALPALRVNRTTAIAGGVAGGLGLVLSGSSAGAIGLAAAAFAAGLVAKRRAGLSLRRAGALAAITGTVVGGVLLQRGDDFDQLFRALGLRDKKEDVGVQTYVQRTLLAYIGWRIFLDHPVDGAGWQASAKEFSTYGPHLDDARREFPNAPDIAFPSREHPWGIQSAYVQAMSDMGAIGLVLLLSLFASGLWIAGRVALRGPPGQAGFALVAALWLLVAMGVWSALGLVAGIPLDGLTWLALGTAVAAAAGLRGDGA